jgi:hypothetical protein
VKLSILWTSMKGRTYIQRATAGRVLDQVKTLRENQYARTISVVGFDWEWTRTSGDRS